MLLDERDVALDTDFLVITDGDVAVALGGVMGGHSTRDDGDGECVSEAAHFAPAAIAGRARKLGMHTDAAHRFERGVDAELPRRALERAAQLIVDACVSVKVGPIVEAVTPDTATAHTIRVAPRAFRACSVSKSRTSRSFEYSRRWA